MTIATAVTYLRRLTKSGADTDRYSQTDYELALRTLGERLVKAIGSVTKGTVALTADSETCTFSGITGFRPARLQNARILADGTNYTTNSTIYGIQKVDYDDVREMQAVGAPPRDWPYYSGVPAFLGFQTDTVANLFPTPSLSGTMNVWTADTFIAFTPGSGNTEVINIAEDYIYDFLEAVADYVQLDDTEARKEYIKSGEWIALLDRARAAGSIGGNISIRSSLRG